MDYTELAKELRELPHLLFVQLGFHESLVYKAADAIEELQKSRWISVKEQLPEKDKDALFYTEWTGQSGTIYKEMQLTTLAELTYHGYRPFAWMPLPEPPEPTKEDAK